MSTTQPIRNLKELKKFKDYYLKQEPNKRNYLLIIMGLNTALRISDLLSLQYKDVYDFEAKKVRDHLILTEKKTKKPNMIYLNQEIKNALLKNLDPAGQSEKSWLFQSQLQKRNPLSRQQAFRIVKKAAFSAGICENVSCHSLRKTFGYFAWKQGVLPAMLMEIYNHSSYTITRRYLGIEQDDKDGVYRKVKI